MDFGQDPQAFCEEDPNNEWCNKNEYRPFAESMTSNGCGPSFFNAPDLNFRHVCDAHDIAYGIGGTEEAKRIADLILYEGIKQSGHPLIAWVYYKSVWAAGSCCFNYIFTPTPTPPPSPTPTLPPTPTPTPSPTQASITGLSNGQQVSGFVNQDQNRTFMVSVPSGTSSLQASITGSGDADLYVKFGSPVTASEYGQHDVSTFKAPYSGGSDESVSFTGPNSGTWYVLVRGYSNANYTLVVTW